ncbi:hypothetical protein BO70DRAFT_394339 [Aspergillus heteromorphus CBS 117.55]|uniref:Uncharacterized protein n=1 Tax=Aspergillus heteromorphus CBS 117.55 TaxID=1448321 RepID=A0A317WM67_9EURO|nr:uncharacterized protein BO70DRAFT_394339 [Aspergillus heteromorphus CBS 117.55]PWY87449.1 hypothetical protein BO70DRAFT_394339 [Aspergillus heteromorphus CBS 117.55]
MAMQICSSFSLYRGITSMYLTVHEQCIQPGLVLVDKLSLRSIKTSSDEDVVPSKASRPDVLQQQKKIIEGLQSRVDNVSHTLEMFRLPDEKTIEMIQESAAVAQAQIDEEVAATPSAMETLSGSLGGDQGGIFPTAKD